MRYFYLLILGVLLSFDVYAPVYAQEAEPNFKADYTVDYYLTEDFKKIQTKVEFTVGVTNLKPDLYVNKLALAFPKQFSVSQLTATDDVGSVPPTISEDNNKTKIELTFNQPKIGRNTVNAFHLSFTQDNLFTINGNVWEVMLPTIEEQNKSSYIVRVHLPPGTDKKISISKPKPDSIENNVITWNSPRTRTIYAVFGSKQVFEMNLLYHLQNPKVVPVYTDVAFPPDTLYQKNYIDQISPQPDEVFIDDDGNYIGRYILKPKSKIDIVYQGMIELFTAPREDVIPAVRAQFEKQKSYLLSPAKHWTTNENQIPKDAKDALSIYSYIVKTLSYNYKKLQTDNKRLGAIEALTQPNQAVCVEYTDVFVALARENGIYARELQGYGFSNDPQLRPLSLISDVLHSWPEYFDTESNLWRPIDPTWEDTSGIDYYNSLDLNHVVFAIHGKNSDYPYPAGTYKTTESKDVSIRAITEEPTETIKLAISPVQFPKQISDNKTYKMKVTLVNNSNIFLWNVPISVSGQQIELVTKDTVIPEIAPYQKFELPIEYKAKKSYTKTSGRINISALNNPLYQASFTIMPYHFELALKISYVVLSFSLIFFLFKYGRRLKKK